MDSWLPFWSSWGVLVSLGVILGGLGVPLGCFWEPFWSHLGAFGWPVAVFLVFCVGKCETVKSVVLLKEN